VPDPPGRQDRSTRRARAPIAGEAFASRCAGAYPGFIAPDGAAGDAARRPYTAVQCIPGRVCVRHVRAVTRRCRDQVLPDPPTRGPACRPVAISSTWVLHRHECRLPRTGVAAPMARRVTHASPLQDRTVRLRFDRCAPRGGAIAHVLRVVGAGRARPAGPSGPTGRRASDAGWRRLPPVTRRAARSAARC
jgi:hypothetical protein